MNELIASVASLSPSEIARATPEELVEIEEFLLQCQAETGAADITLEAFIREGFPVLEPGHPYLDNWHIGAIAEHLTGVAFDQITKLLINIPIRCMKSLTVSALFPAWVWTFRPAFRFLTASYAQNLATRDARKSRLLIQSRWYQQRWGHVFHLSPDQNLKQRYENNRGGFRIATTPGGMGTGEGGDIRISDDPQNAKKLHSDSVRESDVDWWKETWGGRVNDPKHPREVVTMQRLHEQDLSGHILAEHGNFVHLCLPMEYEPERRCVTVLGFEDPRGETGETLLWPERFGQEDVDEMKARLGSYGASGQLQQRPSPVGGGIFKKAWWRFWYPRGTEAPFPIQERNEEGEYVPCHQAPLPAVFDRKVQSWDMTFKATTDSSFVAGQVWYRARANAYLMAQDRRRLEFPDTVRALVALSQQWPETTAKYVEDKANGPAVMQTLRGKVPGLVPVDPEGDKVARAHSVSPYVESGNVWLPHPQLFPWVEDFIERCAAFPTGAFKDEIDAMTQALNRLFAGPVEFDEREAFGEGNGALMAGVMSMPL